MKFPETPEGFRPKSIMSKTKSVLRIEPILLPMLLLLLIVYIIPHTPIPSAIHDEVSRQYNALPEFHIDFHPTRTFRNRFSRNRTAVYIETRNDVAHVTPLLLHMTQVIPPEWRFVFLGSDDLVHRVNKSSPIRRMVEIGKLRLGTTERWTHNWKDHPDNAETVSRLLTNMTFYDEQFPNVEHLLVFRSSAIICANANRTVNDYLDYDWVGAPWNPNDKFGGNGGLSLRRISSIREVLNFQKRLDNTASEDKWLSGRIGLLPNSHPANATVEQGFSVEDIWYDKPVGYHINPGLAPGTSENVWASQERRKQIFEYCPEVKIIMNMRLERERCKPEELNPEGGNDPVTPIVSKRTPQVLHRHIARHPAALAAAEAAAAPVAAPVADPAPAPAPAPVAVPVAKDDVPAAVHDKSRRDDRYGRSGSYQYGPAGDGPPS